jgi:hypothetical protein
MPMFQVWGPPFSRDHPGTGTPFSLYTVPQGKLPAQCDAIYSLAFRLIQFLEKLMCDLSFFGLIFQTDPTIRQKRN